METIQIEYSLEYSLDQLCLMTLLSTELQKGTSKYKEWDVSGYNQIILHEIA